MENFEDNLEIRTKEVEEYVWTCPKCGKKIPGPTKKKVKTGAKQHDVTKHR